MIPNKRPPSPGREYGTGDKRPPESPPDRRPDSKRPRTEACSPAFHEPPPDLARRIADYLVMPVQGRLDKQSTATMRERLKNLAALSAVSRFWRNSLVSTMDDACARYTRLHLDQWHSPSMDEHDRPAVTMPSGFEGIQVKDIGSGVHELLKCLLQPDRSCFESAMVVKGVLKAAAALALTPGVCEDDRLSMKRVPLTILALAFQRGLSADPPRFDDIVASLMAHWARFPCDVQVLLKEDLSTIYLKDRPRLQQVEAAWDRAASTEVKSAALARRRHIQAMNATPKEDLRKARLSSLASMKASPAGFPSSPSYVLTLSWIAHHWATLPCPSARAAQRQGELEQATLGLLAEVAGDIDDFAQRSHADSLLQAFPAPLLQVVLQRLTKDQRKLLLRGLPLASTYLPGATLAKDAG